MTRTIKSELPPIVQREVQPYDAQTLLVDLEPEARRLMDRHLKIAVEWFPHDFIPYSLGRDFDKEPWTPDQPRLTGVARTAFEVNLLTEDNLPSYHRLIHGMFGAGDGAHGPRDRAGARVILHGGGAGGHRARLPSPTTSARARQTQKLVLCCIYGAPVKFDTPQLHHFFPRG